MANVRHIQIISCFSASFECSRHDIDAAHIRAVRRKTIGYHYPGTFNPLSSLSQRAQTHFRRWAARTHVLRYLTYFLLITLRLASYSQRRLRSRDIEKEQVKEK
jgi:hypothetical protein